MDDLDKVLAEEDYDARYDELIKDIATVEKTIESDYFEAPEFINALDALYGISPSEIGLTGLKEKVADSKKYINGNNDTVFSILNEINSLDENIVNLVRKDGSNGTFSTFDDVQSIISIKISDYKALKKAMGFSDYATKALFYKISMYCSQDLPDFIIY